MRVEYLIQRKGKGVSIHDMDIDLEEVLRETVADWIDEQFEDIEILGMDMNATGVSSL